jgi:hypothetical protein
MNFIRLQLLKMRQTQMDYCGEGNGSIVFNNMETYRIPS